MDKFIWTPEYSVGVQIIDDQHRQFFAITNSIIELAQEENPTREKLVALFGELGDYAMYHLGTEESFFRGFDYAGKEAHIGAHDEYRNMVAGHFTGRLNEPEIDLKTLSLEMAGYSGSWLQTHIMVLDKQFTTFFNQHGFK